MISHCDPNPSRGVDLWNSFPNEILCVYTGGSGGILQLKDWDLDRPDDSQEYHLLMMDQMEEDALKKELDER